MTTIFSGPTTTTTSAGPGAGRSFLSFSSVGQHHRRNQLSFRTHATVEKQESNNLSFYDLLGISSEDGFEEIKKAYKRMARRYHPDVAPPDRAEEHTRRFIEVQEAYETLSDPTRRAEYDRRLARGFSRLAFSGARFSGFADEEMEGRSQWRNRWEDQLAELKRRSRGKDSSDENLSWGARMRRKMAESNSN